MMPEYFLKEAEKLSANDDNKVIVKADTLEGLAQKMGVDYSTLRATLNHYNAPCRAGNDLDFGKDPSHLIAYKEDCRFMNSSSLYDLMGDNRRSSY